MSKFDTLSTEERAALEREFPEQICWEEGHDFYFGYCQLCGHVDQEYFNDEEDGTNE